MEEFNKQESKIQEKNWIKKHPIWSGIIGFFILFFVIGIFTPDEEILNEVDTQNTKTTTTEEEIEETSDEDAPKEEETLNIDLSLSLQQEIYYRLIELQDSIDYEDEKYAEKLEASYSVVANYYNISEAQLLEIDITGLTKQWPMPVYEKKWHEIKTFSGKGIKNTETFIIPSQEWRISWDTSPGEYGEMNFQIYIYDDNGNLKGVAANVIGADKDSSIMRGSGNYYLMINTAQPYTIKIEAKY